MTQIEQQNVPKLRFSKFGDGEWSFATLADHLSAHQERVPANTDIPIYSSSRTGLKSQKDYFAGDELRNEGEYGVVPHGFFTYRHMSDDLTFKFNLNNLGHPIAVSKEYPVFETVELDPRFLLDWLNNSPHFSRFAAQQKLGGTRTRLYFKNLKTLRIHLPTLPEQRKIAGFLGAMDERIAQVTRKKALLEDYKKGCMQQLFSQSIRFKDDQGNDFPDWEEKRLGDVAQFSKGKGISKADISEDGTTPCIRYGEIYTHYGEHITEVRSATNATGLFLSKARDVIIPASGEDPLDMARACCVEDAGIALGGDINVLRGAENGVFLAYYLNNAKRKDIARYAQGNSVVHLYATQMRNLSLTLPHPDEQQKIADFLSAIDTKIDLVAQELEQAKTFKKALLQQMFV